MIVMKNFPVMEKILAYSNSVSFVLILIDWEAIIYFITVNMLLVYNQTDSFYKYFIALIENQVEIDIESIRDFYNDLYLHVKIIDQWICFFYGMIYFFTVPSFSIFIHTSFLSEFKIEIVILIFIIFVTIILVILLITIIAISLNTKVCKNRHYFIVLFLVCLSQKN
jgi:hypothetical protein